MTLRLAALFALLIPFQAVAGHEFDGRDLLQGETLYQENCASCHGVKLEGQPNWRSQNDDGILPAPPHDASGHTWHHDNQLLFSYTASGGEEALAERGITNFKSGMPGFKSTLSAEEIWDILAYIRSTWPASIQEIQSARNPPHN
ncbi:c-type cytochrome [Roseovarius aestuarii]|uniref:Cytochrome c6 n=1 Tax=Roseovarius aestuarii TaxID=475083 RepID=A0A1X7BT61_9RHOB|nr:cytochrome c [Roseovarius aestuarii]SMC12831.1 Cytochrome c6 [Roseovarius aestuarii]